MNRIKTNAVGGDCVIMDSVTRIDERILERTVNVAKCYMDDFVD